MKWTSLVGGNPEISQLLDAMGGHQRKLELIA
jgi:hypothetical protein